MSAKNGKAWELGGWFPTCMDLGMEKFSSMENEGQDEGKTPPESLTASLPLENSWLENDLTFLLGFTKIFRGELLNKLQREYCINW